MFDDYEAFKYYYPNTYTDFSNYYNHRCNKFIMLSRTCEDTRLFPIRHYDYILSGDNSTALLYVLLCTCWNNKRKFIEYRLRRTAEGIGYSYWKLTYKQKQFLSDGIIERLPQPPQSWRGTFTDKQFTPDILSQYRSKWRNGSNIR